MPEASVHEHHRLVARQHNVGSTGKVASVKAEAVAEPMQRPSDGELRLCIPLTDTRHHGASLGINCARFGQISTPSKSTSAALRLLVVQPIIPNLWPESNAPRRGPERGEGTMSPSQVAVKPGVSEITRNLPAGGSCRAHSRLVAHGRGKP